MLNISIIFYNNFLNHTNRVTETEIWQSFHRFIVLEIWVQIPNSEKINLLINEFSWKDYSQWTIFNIPGQIDFLYLD